MTAQKYADEVLRQHFEPYAAVQRMDSQHAFLISVHFSMLGTHSDEVVQRPRPPITVQDLEIALLQEWNSIFQIPIASMSEQLGGTMSY